MSDDVNDIIRQAEEIVAAVGLGSDMPADERRRRLVLALEVCPADGLPLIAWLTTVACQWMSAWPTLERTTAPHGATALSHCRWGLLAHLLVEHAPAEWVDTPERRAAL